MGITFHHVQVALTVATFGSVGIGDLFKNKGYEATYRAFNAASSLFALMLLQAATASHWHTNSVAANTFMVLFAPITAVVFGNKFIENLKLAVQARELYKEEREELQRLNSALERE